MNLQQAVSLIEPAVPAAGGAWVDLGAGSGLFTRALASLLGHAGRVVAVDRDAGAVAALRAELSGAPDGWAPIAVAEADFHDADAVAAAVGAPADGVLLANALHFAPDPERVLRGVAGLLAADGRLVVIEYDGRPANRWVPHPVPLARLRTLAAGLSLGAPRVVGDRPSAYGGTMYCAVLRRHPPCAGPGGGAAGDSG